MLSVLNSAYDKELDQSIFLTLTTLQHIMLLPLIGLFIPKDITDLFSGIRYVTLSFSFITFEDSPYVSKLYDELDDRQTNYYLILLDIFYKSTLIYILPLLALLILIILIHCFAFLIVK